MRWLTDSIRARLLAAAALWLTLALLGAWWVIGGVLTGFVTDRFDAEAAAIAGGRRARRGGHTLLVHAAYPPGVAADAIARRGARPSPIARTAEFSTLAW